MKTILRQQQSADLDCRGSNSRQYNHISGRVADLVHFWPDPAPDPDPANQNFENRIRILMALTKNQFKHLNFFLTSITYISSDIEMMIIFI